MNKFSFSCLLGARGASILGLQTGRRMEAGYGPAWGWQGNLGPSFGRNAEIAGARRG